MTCVVPLALSELVMTRVMSAPRSYAMDRATIRQKKTDRPIRFELTNQTRRGHSDDQIARAFCVCQSSPGNDLSALDLKAKSGRHWTPGRIASIIHLLVN